MKTTNKISLLILVTFFQVSCGSGVNDRQVSNSAATTAPISSGQLDALAAAQVEESLQAEGIQGDFDSAKILFSSYNFNHLQDLLVITCKNSNLVSVVNKYHDFATLLEGEEGVIEKIDRVIENAQDEINYYASPATKDILNRVIAQLSTKRADFVNQASICSHVRVGPVVVVPTKTAIPTTPKD